MRVLIAGAGIGGLTAALSLLKQGFDVEVYEQAHELKEVGAGLQLSANGTRVLYQLGVGDALKALSCEATGKEIRLWNSGETWKLFDLGTVSIERYGFPYFTVYRPDLLDVLAQGVRREKRDAIHLNARCVGFHQNENEVTLKLEGGESAAGDALSGHVEPDQPQQQAEHHADDARQPVLLSATADAGDVQARPFTSIAEMGSFLRDNTNRAQYAKIQSLYHAHKRKAHFAVAGSGASTNTARLIVDFNRADLPRFHFSDFVTCESLWLRKDSNNIPQPMAGDNAPASVTTEQRPSAVPEAQLRRWLALLTRPDRLADAEELAGLLQTHGRLPENGSAVDIGRAGADLLRDTIESLAPLDDASRDERLPYEVLKTCFLDGAKLWQAASKLGMSERQMTRERSRAIKLLQAELEVSTPDTGPRYRPEPIPAILGFVARPGPSRKLRKALAEHRLVRVHGPAGVGKTSLVAELAAEVADRTPTFWYRFRAGLNDSLEALMFEVSEYLRARRQPDLAAYMAEALPRPDPKAKFQAKGVEGDITKPSLGLADDDAQRARAETGTVFHLAAAYDLAVDYDIAQRVNVQGTRNVNEFAKSIPNLRRYHYVSTCYVAGRRTGLIREDELEHSAGFRNHYEESKYLAELSVHRLKSEVPITIHRPAVVVGAAGL